MSDTIKELGAIMATTIVGLAALIAAIFIVLVSYRHYDVWAMEMKGKALLAEATQSRQVQIEQAKGELEAAKHRADAIAIVGQAAKEYPEYRQQEYIGAFAEALKLGTINQIIYVPTEGSLPILEAGKR
jgi:regulator of protease activity HflC (stomatin/prohibitin superfamily)